MPHNEEIARATQLVEEAEPSELSIVQQALSLLGKALGRPAPAPAAPPAPPAAPARRAPAPAPAQATDEDEEEEEGDVPDDADDDTSADSDQDGVPDNEQDDADEDEDDEEDEGRAPAQPPIPAPAPRQRKSKAGQSAADEYTEQLHKSWIEDDESGQFAEVVDASDALQYLADKVGEALGTQHAEFQAYQKSRKATDDVILTALQAALTEIADLKVQMQAQPVTTPASGVVVSGQQIRKSKPAQVVGDAPAQLPKEELQKSMRRIGRVIEEGLSSGKYDNAHLLRVMSAMDASASATPEAIIRMLPEDLQRQLV